MATIYNNIDKVAGDPQSVAVTIALVWDTNTSAVAKDTTNSSFIQGPVTVDSDELGAWVTDVVDNDSILPSDNAYKITEEIKSSGAKTTYYINVPAGATPNYWVGDLIISTPSWV